MKNIIALTLVLICGSLLFSGCAGNSDPVITEAPATDAPISTEAPVTTEAPLTEPPVVEVEPPDTLKILAIGNSFSSDAMQYLYQIAADAGVKNIVLGNLYYGGCSLQQHLSFAISDNPVYKYYKNTTGTWNLTEGFRMSQALADEKWDYITLQQTSKTCGLENSYGNTLTRLLDHVEKNSGDAKLVWHMTWAYQQDSTHSAFPSYGKSQSKMYDMIIDCVKNCIEPEDRFALIIPCMTSIQNARTSFIGDNLTRDGYHLDYNIGRYIAGLTYYAAITGAPIDDIDFNPSTANITEDMLAVAKESVKNAIETPNAITLSAFKEGKLPEKPKEIDPSVVLDPADFYEADLLVAAANNVDLSKYTLLEWDYLENTYWNCTAKAGTTTPGASSSTYHQNVCTKQKYTLDVLPIGTIFICDPGWQYRLEIYTRQNAKYTGTRPALSTAEFFVLTEGFMGKCEYISWNIASYPKSDISARYAQAACHLRVYIPTPRPQSQS
ncbi:MAG: DUF4886 domain-containing protein [Clostridia bacterium]|nr:DUF4886 domain-containing protein [Clostridia bacterium]